MKTHTIALFVVTMAVLSMSFITMDTDISAETPELEPYDFSTNYETFKGRDCTGSQASLPSVNDVYVATTDDIVTKGWYRNDNQTNYISVIAQIKNQDTTKVTIGVEGQGFGKVVSYAIIDGKYWTGSVWDALHILSDGGVVHIDGIVKSGPGLDSWQTRGGFIIEGTPNSKIIGNGSIHIDTYYSSLEPNGPLTSFVNDNVSDIVYSFKSISLDSGLWINDFSTNVTKSPGNIRSISLNLDDTNIDTGSSGSLTFYSQDGVGTSLKTSLNINNSKIKVSNNAGIYGCYLDEISVNNTRFDDCAKGIVVTHKSNEQMRAEFKNVTFTDCGYGITGQESSSAPIAVASRGTGETFVNIDGCSFNYVNKDSLNGDVLLGSKDNSSSKNVNFTMRTGSDNCDVKIWKGSEQESVVVDSNTSTTIANTGVGETTNVQTERMDEPSTPSTPWEDDDDDLPFFPPVYNEPEKDDESVKVVACAAAAVVVALATLFLMVDMRKR